MTKICVVGLGKIGLPLALLLAKVNHSVFGVDANPIRLGDIRDNDVNVTEENELLMRYLDVNLFLSQDLHEALLNSKAVFVAIGTGVGSDGTPDLSNLFNLFEKICSNSLNIKNKLFVLKSTLPIGTTRKIVNLIEEKTGLCCGDDFFFAFCPERVLGDRALSEMASLPKVIGGMNKKSSEIAAQIYSTIGGKILIVDSPELAETVKLLDNSYRQTVFAFANDFALLAEKFKLNAYDVIKAANDSYPRNNIPFPSGGVSGYCLTKDPVYLESSFEDIASERGFNSVWFMARKTNDYMPIHMINLLRQNLSSADKDLRDSNVLVCGIAYKENTDDIRNSHGVEIAKKLREAGANVFLFDPVVKEVVPGFKIVADLKDEIMKNMDALVFTVKHDEFLRLKNNDSIMILIHKMRTPVLIDGWGIFQNLIGNKDVFYTSVGIKG